MQHKKHVQLFRCTRHSSGGHPACGRGHGATAVADLDIQYQQKIMTAVADLDIQYQQKIMTEGERYQQLLQEKVMLKEQWDDQNSGPCRRQGSDDRSALTGESFRVSGNSEHGHDTVPGARYRMLAVYLRACRVV